MRYRFLLQHGNQLGNKGIAIADSCDIRLKTFVCRQIRSTNDMAHLRELPVIANSQDELAVGSIECLNSLAAFAFNNPEYCYPSPADSSRSHPGNEQPLKDSPGPGLHPPPAGISLFLQTERLAHPLSRRSAS